MATRKASGPTITILKAESAAASTTPAGGGKLQLTNDTFHSAVTPLICILLQVLFNFADFTQAEQTPIKLI